MVRIYLKSKDKNHNPDSTWEYWGVFKSKDNFLYVWHKKVPKKEAQQYELENELLN